MPYWTKLGTTFQFRDSRNFNARCHGLHPWCDISVWLSYPFQSSNIHLMIPDTRTRRISSSAVAGWSPRAHILSFSEPDYMSLSGLHQMIIVRRTFDSLTYNSWWGSSHMVTMLNLHSEKLTVWRSIRCSSFMIAAYLKHISYCPNNYSTARWLTTWGSYLGGGHSTPRLTLQ